MDYALFDKDKKLMAFLLEGVNDIPVGAVKISRAKKTEMFNAQDVQWIIDGQGKIKSIPIEPKELTREEIEAARLRSYADPLTGSDRLFSEAMRMQIMGEDGFEEVRAKAVARFEEIQAQYPWPSE